MSNKKSRRALRKAEKQAFSKKRPQEKSAMCKGWEPAIPLEDLCQHIGKGRYNSDPPRCLGCGKFLPPELAIEPPPPEPTKRHSDDFRALMILASVSGALFRIDRRRRF